MLFGRSTVKHEIGEYTLKHVAPVRRRAFRYNQVFLSAVGAGAPTLRFRRLGSVPFRLQGTLFGYHCAFTLPLTCLHRRYFSEFYKSVAVCGDYTQRAVAFN